MNRSLTVDIIADISRFQAGMNQATSGLASFAQRAQSIGSALSVSISAPLGLLAHKAIEAYGELDSLQRGLATLEKNSQTLKARLMELQEVAKLPGLGYKEAIQFDVALRSAGFSAELSKRSMLAFGNALGTIGKGKNELKGVSLQLQQLATKTGGYGNDLRVIKEYAPQVGAALQKAFGTVDTEAISKAGITGKQVVEKIVTELEKLPKATGGIKNAFENFSDSAFRSLAKLGESLNKSLGIEGWINGLGAALAQLVDEFATLSPPMQKVIAGFGLAAIAIPPLLAALGFLSTTVLPAVAAGFALIVTPVGAMVAAFAGAAALIITHWDKVKAGLLESNLWDGLKDLASDGLGLVTSIFGVFANLLQGDWTNLWEHLKNTLKYAWNGIIGIIGNGILAIGSNMAHLFSMVGMDKWAAGVKTRMNEVFLTMRSRQFIVDSPKVSGDLFSGFNFGGANADKPGKPPVGTGKGKEKTPETDIEFFRRRVQELGQEIESLTLRGLTVPDTVLDSYSKYTDIVKRADEALKALQKTEISGVKPAESNNVLGSFREGVAEADRTRKFNTALNGGGEIAAPKLPGLAAFQKGLTNAFKPVRKAVVDLNQDLQDGLKQAAISAFVGMGEVIGGLLSGTAGLDQLPMMLLGVLGGLLQQLGEMAIQVGIGVAAIQTALKTLNPVVAVVAGVALIALGAAAKAGVSSISKAPGYETGGLFTGESTIRVGESSKARSGGGEFVAPVTQGADLISDRIMRNMGGLNPSGAGLPGGYSPSSRVAVDVSGQFKISNADLLLAIKRGGKHASVFGNG